ncbi:MAG: hypothetical protein JO326_02765 [Acetobacteraceae bacterium]|nr:hypothetical protein [Acetobacteraceae bacterium]
MIGMTRIALGAHDWLEIALSLPVGVMSAAAVRIAAGSPPFRYSVGVAAKVAFVVALTFHGARLNAEPVIARLVHQHGCASLLGVACAMR